MRCFLIFVLLYLIGCTEHINSPVNHVKDGAPSANIKHNPAKPILTSEEKTLSRYGNRASYQVNGKTYEVLRTAKNYKERGLASWYGTKFHKKNTSSGEDYDLYEYTAAHKTLPLPSYVKVKNLSNNKEIIVKINDRGPFHAKRIIDLSYGAAKKLDITEHGTALVEVMALESAPVNALHANYYVQLGAFKEEAHAELLKIKFKQALNIPIIIEKAKTNFIVKAGPITSKKALENFKKLLVKLGINNAFAVLQS